MLNKQKFSVYLISGSLTSDEANDEHVVLFRQLLLTCGYQLTELTAIEQLERTSNQDLIFYDARDAEEKLAEFYRYKGHARWILFNLQHGDLDECEAIIAGVEGIFYKSDSPELLLKGLRRLAKMDVWFKRNSINEALRRLRQQTKKSAAAIAYPRDISKSVSHPRLTKREITIIELVAQGSQNQEIADQLHISVNTVKTHIYSIFRKTHSRNRIELLSWSQQYVSEGQQG
ncbi:response regulator transcription factor [Aestuariibacter sp. A3R04]|uniref:helix-turn-helix transcriptional regulator n=1 Tax=Aestuariibacter sp. A3R04 TaxID=2841571 RepID=UPI001C093468|nr:response regulator transcription factor [Aestuariibacter sp. A3R04]MBU3023701.1 response regulator transcription factor [Aestuariibacter sp. A3R04]